MDEKLISTDTEATEKSLQTADAAEDTTEQKESPSAGAARGAKRSRRKIGLVLCICWIIAAVVLSSALTAIVVTVKYREYLPLMEAAQRINDSSFYYDAEDCDLTASAIRGMTSALKEDSYATYYTAEEYDALTTSQSGNYLGLGVVVTQQDAGIFVIAQVYEDSPANKAGLLAGDQLIKINGVDAEGLSMDDFLDNIDVSGETANALTVLRGEETLEFSVTAGEVYTPYVDSKMLSDSIGYIHILAFHGECVSEMQTALDSLSEQGMQYLVLDLRDDPGGSLTSVCDIADLLLPKDVVIASMRSKQGDEVVYKTDSNGVTLPIVVLVNGNSASASELLAGALKDNERAYLIGTTTFGKGIVQSFYRIWSSGGMLKLTTDAYYTPSGVCVQGTGITPDETVELDEAYQNYSISYLPREADTQLDAALAYLMTLLPADNAQ